MPGENESSPIETRLEQVEKILAEYERSVGMPELLITETDKNESSDILAINLAHLQKMTPRECQEKAFAIQRYSYFVQRSINKEQSRVRWVEENIKSIIAPRLGQQKGYSFEERKLTAVRENDVAMKLDKIRVHAQLRIDRLSFLTNRLDGMAKALMNIH